MERLPIGLFVAALCCGGCFDVTFSNGTISCLETGLCPGGYGCLDGECVRDVVAIDAAVVVIDAPAPDASSSPRESCAAHRDAGATVDGLYKLDRGGDIIDYWCDMKTAGGGWTVLVNNDAGDLEPNGCVPVIASDASLVCGSPTPGADFASPSKETSFRELLWATHDGAFAITAYQLFVWNDLQEMPRAMTWSLVPDQSSVSLDGLEDLPIIECEFAPLGTPGLRRVGNEPPNQVDINSDWADFEAVTIFDMDDVVGNAGKMSFVDYLDNNDTGSRSGLDDFQDSFGCADAWSPKAERGAASMVMVR